MSNRNPYIVTKALKTFMWGSILAAVSSQIAITTDAIVVSNLIGPNAISAINLMTPVLTVFSCLMILFGIGASIIAAKAIGRRDENSANGVFTAAILSSAGSGVILAIFTFIFSPWLVDLLSGGNQEIYPLALSYLQVMCVCVPFMMMAGVIENFVKIDGRPRIVMTAVICGSVLNLILDIVFVKWLGMGIAGSAWATGINYLAAILICMWHFQTPYNSLKWNPDWERMKSYVKESVSQGIPMSLNTLLLGGCVLLINYIVLFAEGSEGIYCWSVCLQLFMIMQMVLTGIGSSIYSIGGILVGEWDMEGLAILNRKSILYTISSLAVITIIIIIFPHFFGELFGSRSDNPIEILPNALRAFSIMLVPYAIVALLRSTYQILGRIGLSLFLSVFQLVLMIGFVWGFSFINSFVLWWGFPSSSVVLLIGLIIYTLVLHEKNKEIRTVTLIPETKDSESFSLSVRMDQKSVNEADKKVTEFLKNQSIDDLTSYKVRLNCEELMHNILNHAVAGKKEKHYFDVRIRILKDSINVLLKDDGRPFNPVLSSNNIDMNTQIDDKIGLKLVNFTADSISYKYMYDQNVVMLTFPRN